FSDDAEVPATWECRLHGTESEIVDGVQQEQKKTKPARTHWDMLLERRSISELEALLNERLEELRARRSASRSASQPAADVTSPKAPRRPPPSAGLSAVQVGDRGEPVAPGRDLACSACCRLGRRAKPFAVPDCSRIRSIGSCGHRLCGVAPPGTHSLRRSGRAQRRSSFLTSPATCDRRCFRPHRPTCTMASSTIEPLIFDLPSSRSVNVIGTSTTEKPARMVRQVRSIWKQ